MAGVTTRPTAVIAMSDHSWDSVFSTAARTRLRTLVDVLEPALISRFDQPDTNSALSRAEIMITGWGTPAVDDHVLARAENLRAIVHTAGTVKTFLSQGVFDRGIRVTSSAAANATPVAEFTVAAMVFGRKRAARFADQFRSSHRYRDESGMPPIGFHRTTVGLVGASRVGREVIRLLRSYDVEVLVSDPYLSADEAAALGVEQVALPDLCARSDILSLHAPLTPSTTHLIGRAELALLRDGAVVINTARGQLIDTAALERECRTGRIDGYLDVTDPEPLPHTSVLHSLPNVTLTPHIAGALGNEVHRLGDLAVAEVAAYVQRGVLHHEVHVDDLVRIA